MLTQDKRLINAKSGPRRNVNAKTNKHYSDSQKLEVVQAYLALGGNTSAVSKTLGINVYTIYAWMRTDWWKELIDQIKKQENLTLSTTLKRIIDNSLTVIEERLEKGDYIYNQKTGVLSRKPVSMKDAAKLTTDLIDKRIKIESKESFTIAQENIAEKLATLAASFAELANKPKPQIEVTDVIFAQESVNAVHEERKEGL